MTEFGFGRALQFRHNTLRRNLSQLYAPLVERIQIPDDALCEDVMLVKRDELAQSRGFVFDLVIVLPIMPRGLKLSVVWRCQQLRDPPQTLFPSEGRASLEEIQVKITGGELGGNASGSGKVLLSNDRKNISELAITGKSSNGCDVTIRFTADRSDDSQKDGNPILLSASAVAATTAMTVRSEKIPLVIY
jgi:hypothetical protein